MRDVLRDVRALLTDPARWTRRVLARDVNGVECRVEDPRAVAFCLLGAFYRIQADHEWFEAGFDAVLAVYAVAHRRHGMTAGALNDSASHEQVLAVLDEAMAGAVA